MYWIEDDVLLGPDDLDILKFPVSLKSSAVLDISEGSDVSFHKYLLLCGTRVDWIVLTQ